MDEKNKQNIRKINIQTESPDKNIRKTLTEKTKAAK